MEASQIPRTFWHTLSVAILASTVVLLYIALRSTNISIEIANTKINLNRAISETGILNEELKEQNEAFLAAKEELQQRYNEMVASLKVSRTITPKQIEQFNPRNLQLDRYTISEDRFVKNQNKMIELRNSLD